MAIFGGLVLKGIDADDRSGLSVSSAGDVNADGIDDLLIGASGAGPNGSYSGQTYVVFGSSTRISASFELADLDGSNGFVLNGIDADDRSGLSVSSAGDVNADGIDDLLIGASGAGPNGSYSGQTYVVFGSSTRISASFELADLDGSNGFVLNGIDADDRSGLSVSSAGDVNADGIDDLLIGASGAGPNGSYSGQTYVVFGSSDGFSASFELADLDGTNGFVLNGIDASDGSGGSVSSAGDVNADGIDDLLIGASGADPNGSISGETYVVFGSSDGFSARFELADLDGTNGFVLNGIDARDGSGGSVSSAGDVNADGIDDLLIGARGAAPNGRESGETYVVFGSSDGFSASFELADLDGTNGFVLKGFGLLDGLGDSVSSAGDVNGDGIDDLLIGAPGANGAYGDRHPGFPSGETYVVFGSSAGFSASFDLADLDGTNGFVLKGIGRLDSSGDSVSSAGDVNGDGIDDLLIGAPRSNPNGPDSGVTYVVFGGKTLGLLDAEDGTSDGIIKLIKIGRPLPQIGTAGPDVMDGTANSDSMKGLGGADTLKGYGGNDKLFGGSGRDTLKGGKDNDKLWGGKGFDTLKGGEGRDTLNGDKGNDKMTGGKGQDAFVFSAGNDKIRDFNVFLYGEWIDLSDVAPIIGFNDLINNHVSEVNGNVVIDDLAGNTLKLLGVSIADLQTHNFFF